MRPTPTYTPPHVRPAYHLRFGWTGWVSNGAFPPFPEGPHREALIDAWEREGVRLLEHHVDGDHLQATFSTQPQVAPAFLAARVKGRLQYAYREMGSPVVFRRKLAVRAIGDNTRDVVEQYVHRQLDRADLADPRYRENMRLHHQHDPTVRLDQPFETASGRYWYNLHLVCVTADRFRMGSGETPAMIRATCLQTVAKHGCALVELSVMADHIHLALKANPEKSPEELALGLMNNTAWRLGRVRFWEAGYYAGTFGEYTMRAVRH